MACFVLFKMKSAPNFPIALLSRTSRAKSSSHLETISSRNFSASLKLSILLVVKSVKGQQ